MTQKICVRALFVLLAFCAAAFVATLAMGFVGVTAWFLADTVGIPENGAAFIGGAGATILGFAFIVAITCIADSQEAKIVIRWIKAQD